MVNYKTYIILGAIFLAGLFYHITKVNFLKNDINNLRENLASLQDDKNRANALVLSKTLELTEQSNKINLKKQGIINEYKESLANLNASFNRSLRSPISPDTDICSTDRLGDQPKDNIGDVASRADGTGELPNDIASREILEISNGYLQCELKLKAIRNFYQNNLK